VTTKELSQLVDMQKLVNAWPVLYQSNNYA